MSLLTFPTISNSKKKLHYVVIFQTQYSPVTFQQPTYIFINNKKNPKRGLSPRRATPHTRDLYRNCHTLSSISFCSCASGGGEFSGMSEAASDGNDSYWTWTAAGVDGCVAALNRVLFRGHEGRGCAALGHVTSATPTAHCSSYYDYVSSFCYENWLVKGS